MFACGPWPLPHLLLGDGLPSLLIAGSSLQIFFLLKAVFFIFHYISKDILLGRGQWWVEIRAGDTQGFPGP